MKDFKRGGSGGGFGGKKFGGNRGGVNRGGSRGGFGGGNRGGNFGGDREMFQATCSECGKRCDVPFRPTGEKPVYCNDCFGGKRDGSFERNDRGSDRGSRNDRPQKEFTKPASVTDDRSIIELKKSVETLNSKLDSMIRMIQDLKPETKVPAKKESLGTIVKEATASKAPVKKAAKKTAAKPAKAPAKKSAKKSTKK